MAGAFDYRAPSTVGIHPAGLINAASVASIIDNTVLINNSTRGLPNSLVTLAATGALTAGTLATVLSLSGKGAISFLACGGVDVTARTHRLKVTLDGVVIYDGTTASTTNSGAVLAVIGSFAPSATTTPVIVFEPLVFNSSLLVEYASSVTETAKSVIAYRYFGM